MRSILRTIKVSLNIFILLITLGFIFITFAPAGSTKGSDMANSRHTSDEPGIAPYILNDENIVHDIKKDSDAAPLNTASSGTKDADTNETARDDILKRAEMMTEVTWSPKVNMVDKEGFYIFRKGQTYKGVPYSMGNYQVTSPEDFLTKISKSKSLLGNDCSGFVSAAWGISRQTTLSLYNAVKQNKKVDNTSVHIISWEDLKPGDALLLDNGKGKGHIMLFIDYDPKNKDKLYVYEQNVATIIPYEPVPVARKDERSKERLKKEGYIPIRLMDAT